MQYSTLHSPASLILLHSAQCRQPRTTGRSKTVRTGSLRSCKGRLLIFDLVHFHLRLVHFLTTCVSLWLTTRYRLYVVASSHAGTKRCHDVKRKLSVAATVHRHTHFLPHHIRSATISSTSRHELIDVLPAKSPNLSVSRSFHPSAADESSSVVHIELLP